jgi:hypothetical protein
MPLHGCVGRPADFSGAEAGARREVRGTTTGTTRVRRRYDASSVGTGTTGTTPYMGVVPSRVVVVLFVGTTRYTTPPVGCPVSALRCSSSVPRTALGTAVRRTPS